MNLAISTSGSIFPSATRMQIANSAPPSSPITSAQYAEFCDVFQNRLIRDERSRPLQTGRMNSSHIAGETAAAKCQPTGEASRGVTRTQ